MAISLRAIDGENFWPVIKLNVAEDQQNFVAPNVRSIAECIPYPYLVPRAVYSDDELVGFALYGRDPDTNTYWLVRLMIDAAHQRKGFGRAAALQLLETIGGLPGCDAVFLSYVPANSGAADLYLELGFVPTGETDESGEVIMRCPIPPGCP